ncbi:MAG: DUF2203 domain-containing protein [Verrucomicrobiota bacterium]|nr:DUF2203 domain-containing protein [Verrucomicrobiota bacterium]
MSTVYKRHYTREEARALLPQLRKWLDQLSLLRDKLADLDERISRSIGLGDDLGGSHINAYVTALADTKQIFQEFEQREIQIKDVDRGLIDFPAFIAGREVFLCWEKDEEDVEHWHDLETGYSGREKI